MTAYVALLRAINVGGTGKLAMSDLKRLCEEAGFEKVRTYIASGNVVFASGLSEAKVKAALEAKLEGFAGKRIPVVLRNAAEMAAVARTNPFPDEPANQTVAIFLDDSPPKDALDQVKGRGDEKLALGKREIFVTYGATGQARSKLKIAAAKEGTARNVNSVAKLAEMAAEIG